MTATAVTTRTATMHEDLEKNQKTSQVCNIITSFSFSQNFRLNNFLIMIFLFVQIFKIFLYIPI